MWVMHRLQSGGDPESERRRRRRLLKFERSKEARNRRMAAATSAGDIAVLVSGGVDSAVLIVDSLNESPCVHPIYVRFGLRWEEFELAGLRAFLREVGATRPGIAPLTVLDEPIAQVYGEHWSNAGRPGVPGAETPDEAVYLPGRNVLLATKAAVWCHLRGIRTLAFGTLAANPFPDSTPEFFRDLESVLNRAPDGAVADRPAIFDAIEAGRGSSRCGIAARIDGLVSQPDSARPPLRGVQQVRGTPPRVSTGGDRRDGL